ncbi:MAG: aryl-sulfate sulfotransferase, partial [Bacteroidia bacterium]|nr:aryl-sulfate sulfotransferase [Bacteroidia bacterium]
MCLIFFKGHSQTGNTVGVTELTTEVSDGYTFFSPFSGTKAYLIDNCGKLINSWDRGTRPGLSAYLLENGLMLRTYKTPVEGPFTSASNAGGLELVDWNNNTLWKYEIDTPETLSHHDAVMLPTGNILVLTWELVYRDELIELGRDPDEIAVENFMWSERIIELEPLGPDSAEIVWEWRIKDHYIQDFDSTKTGYGVIKDHPELFNINLPDLNSSNSNASRDWNHFNAIDYNPKLDQVLISVRNSNEIWILDHSTTTEEAASHRGGRYNKGGDILYRWGNPFAYGTLEYDDQQFFGQHGAHWVTTEGNYTDQILIFNNGNRRPPAEYSSVEILSPPEDSAGFYSFTPGNGYGPVTAEVLYGNQTDQAFYSPYLSNAQILYNGNILINEGSSGFFFEINNEKDIVWSYEVPLWGDFPVSQGDNVIQNAVFRVYKYPADYPAFQGKDLTPGETIERNSPPCSLTVSNSEVKHNQVSVRYISEINQLVFS